jgi:two-component system LytT family response regulator
MPVMGGLEVVRNLGGENLPVVIIVTAYDEYAIQAFEAGAIDYLVKPVRELRLRKALERAEALNHKAESIANQIAKIAHVDASGEPGNRKIVGRERGEYFLLDPNDILAFQAEGELVWIVTAKQRLLATQTLRSLEERLKTHHFTRVHRNALVNVNHVRKITALSSQRWILTLSNALQLVVSKRLARNIRMLLR